MLNKGVVSGEALLAKNDIEIVAVSIKKDIGDVDHGIQKIYKETTQ